MESKYVVEVQELPRGDRGEVVQRLAQSFGVGADKAEGLLRRAPGVVTKPISQQEAQTVAKLFVQAGVVAEVRPLTEATQSAVAATDPLASESTSPPVAPEVNASTSVPEEQSAGAPDPAVEPLSEEDASVSSVEVVPETGVAVAEIPAAEDATAPDAVVEPSSEADTSTAPVSPTDEEAAVQTSSGAAGEILYPEEADAPAEGYAPRAGQGPRILLAVIILAIIVVILILWLR